MSIKPSKLQNSMSDSLKDLRPKIRTRQTNLREPTPSPMNWVEDGVDHINIWDKANTELGRKVCPNSKVPFVHSLFGRFSNMEAFWHYIQSKERDDQIRLMSGQKLKAFFKKCTPVRVANFRAIIMDTNYQRIFKSKSMTRLMEESTLPFDFYYVIKETGLRMRPVYFKWYIVGMEEIRQAIKEKREPDFTFLLDSRNSTIYEFVLPPPPKPEAQPKVVPVDPPIPAHERVEPINGISITLALDQSHVDLETEAQAIAKPNTLNSDAGQFVNEPFHISPLV